MPLPLRSPSTSTFPAQNWPRPATLVTLSAHSTQATNTIDQPTQIVPVETALHGVSSHLHHTVPGYAIQVIELDEQ